MKLTKQQLLELDKIKKENPQLVSIVKKFREKFGAVKMTYLKVGNFELGKDK